MRSATGPADESSSVGALSRSVGGVANNLGITPAIVRREARRAEGSQGCSRRAASRFRRSRCGRAMEAAGLGAPPDHFIVACRETPRSRTGSARPPLRLPVTRWPETGVDPARHERGRQVKRRLLRRPQRLAWPRPGGGPTPDDPHPDRAQGIMPIFVGETAPTARIGCCSGRTMITGD